MVLSPFAARNTREEQPFRKCFREERIAKLRDRLIQHKPEFCIFHGRKDKNFDLQDAYKKITADAFDKDGAKVHTQYVVTSHLSRISNQTVNSLGHELRIKMHVI